MRNFKRFSDLTVSDVPASARLVVVVGPNGCGKSSLFDALLHWYRIQAGFGVHQDETYFRKNPKDPFQWHEIVTVRLHNDAVPIKGSLYVRTAYRNDPDFSVSGFHRLEKPSEIVRFSRVIDNDATVSDNYQRLVYDTVAGVYDVENDSKSVRQLREELIGDVRASMRRVFGDLLLNSISDPLGDGTFYFGKGIVGAYHYKNLSGGEKSAFDLLLDLHIKRRFFADAIYCVDEVETHLHTRVQGSLVQEMVSILPDEAQLWITTHSLGVLRAAQELAASSPGTVAIIDFDGVDPDVPQTIVPSSLDRIAWEKFLSLMLDDLSPRIAPRVVVVCEGSSYGKSRRDFDAEIYQRILGARHPDLVFMSGGSSEQVIATGASARDVLARVLPGAKVVSLVDRDDKSANEVLELESNGGIVLPCRNLESYLFADDVIEALVSEVGRLELLGDALALKQRAITASVARNNPRDDLKSAAGEIYNGLKQLLELQGAGNSTSAFMRDTLAPLIGPGMTTYEELRAAIVDRVK